MDEILELLKNADQQHVKLYFLERNYNRNSGDIKYQVLGTTIFEKLRIELMKIGQRQVKEKINQKPEIIQYGTIPYYDRPHIECVVFNEVPFLNDIIVQFVAAHKNMLVEDKIKKIFGYIIKLDVGDFSILFLKKYTSKKFISKGKIAIVFGLKGLSYIDKNIVTLDKEFDAVTVIKKGEDIGESKIFIFNRSKFESLLSFVDFYQKEVEAKKEDIENFDVIVNVDDFVEYCKHNMIMVKKLSRIIRSEDVKYMTKVKIEKTVEDYQLQNIEFDSEGKMIATIDNVSTILHILEDDYVLSEATKIKYEAHSKVKR